MAEVLRVRGRKLLTHPALDLAVAADAWSEAEHELRKRVALLIKRGHLEAAAAGELLDAAVASIANRAILAPRETYAGHLEEALRRVPRDPRDAPTVALALAMECGIWAGDFDYFGCGVPVWTTATLRAHLETGGDTSLR